MKARFALLSGVLFLLLIVGASAQWGAINSGYAVTTDWHGKDVPLGTTITVKAGTTNLDVVEVKFRWLRPNGTEAWDPIPVTSYTEELWEGQIIRVFENARTPDTLGDWGVQAVFYDGGGNGVGPIPNQPEKIAIRATSFNMIPEIPIVGTAGAVVAMLLGLGLFYKKRQP